MSPRTFRLRPVPDDVRVAREHCARAALHAYGPACTDLVDDAEMVTSELVTNAIRAGASLIVLELEAVTTRLHIAVVDDAAGDVAPRTPEPFDTNGRGLHIIGALARRWGVDPLPAGKRVWAELPVPAAEADGDAGEELTDVAS